MPADSLATRSPGPAGLREQIDALTHANRERRDPEIEQRLVGLRHRVGLDLLDSAPPGAEHPAPDFERLDGGRGLPEVAPEDLTAALVRAAILRHGCVVVRGLVDPEAAERFAERIERAFQVRAAEPEGDRDGYYRPFQPEGSKLLERGFVTEAGGIWAGDSPRLLFEMLEMFERRGLPRIVREYLGEAPAFSLQKCTFRKVSPDTGHGFPGWHQDGRFLGPVRALNLWLTLTRCGEDAPGLDLVPQRIDRVLPTGTEGAIFDWVVAPDVVEQAGGEAGVVRPIFEPGDAVLFDDLFLHATAADPSMPRHRYAVESWFFGPSGFPDDYVPLAL